MKGQVLDFNVQTSAGAISGSDGKRYTFTGADWRDSKAPQRGMTVDFDVQDANAISIYQAIGATAATTNGPRKDKIIAGLLAIFLGGLGLHKFYLGRTGPGLVFLLLNTVGFYVTWLLLFIPNFVLGVIALIEGIIYLTRSDEDFQRTYVEEKRAWF